MQINNVEIKDNYAEAFGIKVSRLLVTAATKKSYNSLRIINYFIDKI